jgi:hypothetical protein
MSEITDQVARDKASAAAHAVANHIQVTAIQLTNLEKKIDTTHATTDGKIDRLESILKWAGGLIIMLFLSTLTWSLAQQYNSNEATKRDLQQQVELLKMQQQSAARAAETAAPSVSVR